MSILRKQSLLNTYLIKNNAMLSFYGFKSSGSRRVGGYFLVHPVDDKGADRE